ncbi:MAG: hypothetical protein MUP09_00770 [Thiovulaceae bacterium]|nr:hypothetical protein [Sulfurimonadaceae bacterium]
MQETVLALLEAHSYLAFLGAFGAGAVTAAAPCSLVTVPLLVGSAVALNSDLSGHKKVLYTYLFASLFALGVMVSFSALGFAVAKFGAFFSVAPFWAYLAAGGLSIAIAFYAFGIIPAVDKSGVMRRLIEFRLFGAFVIGIVFGLVSTPLRFGAADRHHRRSGRERLSAGLRADPDLCFGPFASAAGSRNIGRFCPKRRLQPDPGKPVGVAEQGLCLDAARFRRLFCLSGHSAILKRRENDKVTAVCMYDCIYPVS